jgi:hypothetical protein
MNGPDDNAEPHHDGPLAGLMADLVALSETQVSVAVGEIMAALGARGHGPIILTLAAFMMLPLGMLPFMPSLVGVLLALTAAQMLMRGKAVTLPAFIARRRIDGETLRLTLARAVPLCRRLGRVLHPRWDIVVQGDVFHVLIALYLLAAAVVIIVLGGIPGLPFMLCIPALLFGLGMTAGDGLVVSLGLAVTAPVALAVLGIAPEAMRWLGW